MKYACFRIFFLCVLKGMFDCTASSFWKKRNARAWNFSVWDDKQLSYIKYCILSSWENPTMPHCGRSWVSLQRSGRPQVLSQSVIVIWLSINLFLSEPNPLIVTPFKACAHLWIQSDLILTVYKSSDSLRVALISSFWSNYWDDLDLSQRQGFSSPRALGKVNPKAKL